MRYTRNIPFPDLEVKKSLIHRISHAVVGGLRDKGIIPAGADFNNLEPGIYTVNKDNLQNQPVNLLGTLIYFGTNYGMQIYTPILEYALYYRTKDVGSSSWKNWTKLTGVSISLNIGG